MCSKLHSKIDVKVTLTQKKKDLFELTSHPETGNECCILKVAKESNRTIKIINAQRK